MEYPELKVEIREKVGKGEAKRIRKRGFVPGVIYGGEKNIHIVVNPSQLKSLLKGPMRLNTILKLTFPNRQDVGEKTVMVKDYQVDPIKDTLIHVDFMEVSEDRKILVDVPVKLEGTPQGVKKGGAMQWNIRALKIRCKPSKIPPYISINVSPLDLGGSIHIIDIPLPEGVEVVMDKTLPIVTITEVFEEVAAKAEVAPEEVAPVEEKKEEKEGEEKEGVKFQAHKNGPGEEKK